MISADKLLKQLTQPNMHYTKIATYTCALLLTVKYLQSSTELLVYY